jgi:hypothetical protein
MNWPTAAYSDGDNWARNLVTYRTGGGFTTPEAAVNTLAVAARCVSLISEGLAALRCRFTNAFLMAGVNSLSGTQSSGSSMKWRRPA